MSQRKYPLPTLAPWERLIGIYDFEDSSTVRLVVAGEVKTEDALRFAEKFIALKRRELAGPASPTTPDDPK